MFPWNAPHSEDNARSQEVNLLAPNSEPLPGLFVNSFDMLWGKEKNQKAFVVLTLQEVRELQLNGQELFPLARKAEMRQHHVAPSVRKPHEPLGAFGQTHWLGRHSVVLSVHEFH
jgi:hypothetical protein